MSDHLEQLVLQVESSAEWRASKAEQYPDDKRNVRSNQALTKLAGRLKQMSPADASLEAYDTMMDRAVELETPLNDIVQAHSRYIGRYGFDYPQNGDPSEFLAGLTDECRGYVDAEEERVSEEEDEERYEAAKEAAGEAAKEAADEAAKEAAEEAAKEAAEEAYREAYDETYKEVYNEVYKETLMEELRSQ